MLCIASLSVWLESHTDECATVFFGNLCYEFQLGQKPKKAIKNIYHLKADGAVDHSRVTTWEMLLSLTDTYIYLDGWWVGFYGILTFLDYLMLNPSLYK